MGIFSFLKEKEAFKCDWCGSEIEEPTHFKYVKRKKFLFCSEHCKQAFKKSGKGKPMYNRCPTCAMAPKSWD